MDSIDSKKLYSIIKSRDFEKVRAILIEYMEKNIEQSNYEDLQNKIVQLTYNNNIHRSKVFSYRTESELVYKIIQNMFPDIKFLLFYDWDMDIDILTNLINILIKNDYLTMNIKKIEII